MTISTSSYAHIRLTVTDLDRSRAFYEQIFGWPVAAEVPADADADTRARLAYLFNGVMYRVGDQILGLRPVANDRFDEDRVGLDHISFTVDSPAALDAAVELLDERGVPHEAVKDIGEAYILQFRDPDNIALELMAAKPDRT